MQISPQNVYFLKTPPCFWVLWAMRVDMNKASHKINIFFSVAKRGYLLSPLLPIHLVWKGAFHKQEEQQRIFVGNQFCR